MEPQQNNSPPLDVFRPDFLEAETHTTVLDQEALGFQFVGMEHVLDASGKERAVPRASFYGTLLAGWATIERWQSRRWSVFIVSNATDGYGRTKEHVTRIRTVVIEADDGHPPTLPEGIEPTLVCETSPGRYHYWFVVDGEMTEEHRAGIQRRLVADYGSDPNAKDAVRLLRLAGTWNFKKRLSEPCKISILWGRCTGDPIPTSKLSTVFPPIVTAVRTKSQARSLPRSGPISSEEIDCVRDALKYCPGHTRADWFPRICELHAWSGGSDQGLDVAAEWSERVAPEKFDYDDTERVWASLGKNPDRPGRTIDSLYWVAEENGWAGPRYQPPFGPDEPMPESPVQSGLGLSAPSTAALFTDATRWLDRTPQPRQWIVDGYFPSGFVGLVVANGGVGKSTLMAQLMCSVAAGSNFLGKVTSQGAAAGLFCEDDEDRLQTLMFGIAARMGRDFADLAPSLFPISLLGQETTLWNERGRTALLQRVAAEVKRLPKLRLLVLDGGSDMFADDDFNRQAVRSFMQALTQIAQANGLAIVLILHESRNSAKDGAHPASGSTAWVNSSRSTVRLMADDKAPDQRTLAHTKCNLGPRMPILALTYDGLFFEPFGGERFRELQRLIADAVAQGRNEIGAEPRHVFSSSAQAGNYLPRAIRDQIGGTIASFSETEIERAMRAMLQSGELGNEEYGKAKRRKPDEQPRKAVRLCPRNVLDAVACDPMTGTPDYGLETGGNGAHEDASPG